MARLTSSLRRSDGEVASFANFVFFRYFCSSTFRSFDPSGYRARNAFSSALSCGLFLRIIMPTWASLLTAASLLSTSFGKTCCQNEAMSSRAMVVPTSPAFTISRMSSSARTSGAGLMVTGGRPFFASSALNRSTAPGAAADS